MRVIGVVGMPGSGKSEAAAVARELDIPVVTMGDVIRQEAVERGLDPKTEHGRVAQQLREEGGKAAIADHSLPGIRDALEESDVVLVDGIRSDAEVEVFEDEFEEDFTLVEVYAPFEVRRERIETRSRDASEDEGGESLEDRDRRELGFGMGKAIEDADQRIENTDSLAAFRDQIRSLLTTE